MRYSTGYGMSGLSGLRDKTIVEIKKINANSYVMYRDGNEILFSYRTPVAVYDAERDEYLRTDEKYSTTTTRHINKWLDGVKAKSVSQRTIDKYVGWY